MLTTSLACFFVAIDYKIVLDVLIPHCLLVLSDIFQKPLVVVIFSSSPGTNHFFFYFVPGGRTVLCPRN